MKRYWLVTTSYQRSGVHLHSVVCNKVIDYHPAEYLRRIIDDYPEMGYRLLFAMEIDKEQYKMLNGVV